MTHARSMTTFPTFYRPTFLLMQKAMTLVYMYTYPFDYPWRMRADEYHELNSKQMAKAGKFWRYLWAVAPIVVSK